MNEYLLFFIALAPIVWLMVSLGALKMPGHKTCSITLAITILLAVLVWKMPVDQAMTAALEGSAMALWPIIIVIIAAVFTYNLSIHTKSMEVIKNMMVGITTDRRILVLIVAWGFGGFLEAIAGFGTAVAIPASILAALGFEPVFAAIICLIANTTPTAFGAIGLPVTTLAKIAGIDASSLSYAVSVQLFVLIIVVPLALVMLTGKSIKAVKGVTLISLASGLAFALPQIFAAKYLGAELPALLGSVICIAVTVAMAKIFYKNTASAQKEPVSLKEGLTAWTPFILVLAFILLTSTLVPGINRPLSAIKTSITIFSGPGAKPTSFAWIANPGTLIILAAFIGGLIQGAKFAEILKVLAGTCKQMAKSIITILAIVSLAKVMSYSGMITSIAAVLVAITGGLYPIFAPLIGALGTFVTGSDTSANVLFGPLQIEVAKNLNMSPYWMAAANTGGATAGKMISPQSIAVATAATGIIGTEGRILKATLKFCLVYLIILGFIVYFGAGLFPM
ncbi:MAG TPA: L-lactate permease [Clostridia bacterium]|nr:L-lactate permease [Clostridia bacterium]